MSQLFHQIGEEGEGVEVLAVAKKGGIRSLREMIGPNRSEVFPPVRGSRRHHTVVGSFDRSQNIPGTAQEWAKSRLRHVAAVREISNLGMVGRLVVELSADGGAAVFETVHVESECLQS